MITFIKKYAEYFITVLVLVILILTILLITSMSLSKIDREMNTREKTAVATGTDKPNVQPQGFFYTYIKQKINNN